MSVNADAIPSNPFTNPGAKGFFAMFLLGLYAGRRQILHDVKKHAVMIRRVLWWGLTVGLLSMTGERILNATVGYKVFREGAHP